MDRLTAHIDIEPTLLNACGVPRPSNVKMNGVSLYPLLRNRAMDWKDRAIYFQWHGCERAELYRSCAARSQHYRLVNGKELYDLQEDPGEQRDVPSAHPDVVAKMLVGHQAWSRDVSSTELRAAANLHRHEDREPGHADSPGLGLG